MAKKITGYIKLQVPAGTANPSPPIGPALGQRGVNIMEFCKAFNAATGDMEKSMPIPTIITVYADRSFSFETKTPPASFLIKKAANRSRAPRSRARSVRAGSAQRADPDRRDQDEGSQRQRHRGGDPHHRRLRPRDGPRSWWRLRLAKLTKKQKALAGLDPQKLYGVDEAINLAKTNATAKFDETIEIALNLGVDPRHADQWLLRRHPPAGTGKNVRVAVFARATRRRGDRRGRRRRRRRRPDGNHPGGTIDFDGSSRRRT